MKATPIAGTFSKDPSFWGGNFPVQHITRGKGCYVWDQNQRAYIDWVSGLGAVLLGYDDSKCGFSNYIAMFARNGNGFSLPHYLENEVAERLVTLLGPRVPGWHGVPLQVRWVKTGSDSCNAAIRLARAVMGKDVIYSYGYHGWADDFISITPPAYGIVARGNSIRPLDEGMIPLPPEGKGTVAAVILEHGIGDLGPEYYRKLRAWCDDNQAMLIMDEVVTGFRYALGGVCEKFDIEPDLICIGKALGNGYPIAALVGPAEYMKRFSDNSPVFVSSTNAGDTVSLAAANYFLSHWNEKAVAYIWEKGEQLLSDLKHVGYNIIGHPPRSLLTFSNPYAKAYFIRKMADNGILMNRPNFPTMEHSGKDVAHTVVTARRILHDMLALSDDELKRTVLEMVGGEDGMPTVLFARR